MVSKKKRLEASTGFLYRGLTKIVSFGAGRRVRLVNNETYVIVDLSNASTGEVPVTLKKSGASLALSITLREYYQHLSSGRSSFKDLDPYM